MARIAVVGAGPVGLFTACLLAGDGHEVVVLEQLEARRPGSRSIGIHPPALEALAVVEVASSLVECGVPIRAANVYLNRRHRGSLSLENCPPPFRFVLSLPQSVTERLLERRLMDLAPDALRTGARVEELRLEPTGVRLELAGGDDIAADFVIGCDGRSSRIRSALQIRTSVTRHEDHYLMADLPDTSDLGDEAAIYLTDSGVVESFPLPNRGRRWVARVAGKQQGSIESLDEVVRRRTGHALPADPSAFGTTADSSVGFGEASAFTAETRFARAVAGERWALVGDAAHVVPPIGGQGMNLGWLGALALARELSGGIAHWNPAAYSLPQMRRARAAARRSRLNMALGREDFPRPLRHAAVAVLLAPSLQAWSARYFTMRGL